ncbi:hypothetical protein CY34DRAFT_541235 [Suillus luteus UH-Slu-Lm8-n1]|uniref:Uncharacterized protein n=1 Tax=Suillus luteus UH-Slu-Lm8-n1 TaxID=930992 RepID=A0A0D0BGV3_9AGAM|nr:hypothetical protein CY34DRAFT_541235 [Suillus luteus UH-Slu-Lm8-n1]
MHACINAQFIKPVFQQVPWPAQDRHNYDGRSIRIIGEDIKFLSSAVRRPADVLSPMILRQVTTSTYHKCRPLSIGNPAWIPSPAQRLTMMRALLAHQHSMSLRAVYDNPPHPRIQIPPLTIPILCCEGDLGAIQKFCCGI